MYVTGLTAYVYSAQRYLVIVVVRPESAPLARDIYIYIDLSKLSNLGTYQEIGKC